jgi:Calcium-binding EGF domain
MLALACASACKQPEEVAQTILWVDAEPAAQTAIARLKIQVEGPSDKLEPELEAKDPDWPIKLVLAPKNADAGRSFKLHIAAYDAQDSRLATIRLASGFAVKQARYGKLLIHSACVQARATCDDCNTWSLEHSASALSRDAKQPRVLDAVCSGMSPPTSTDAGSAGSVNAGQGAPAGSGPTAGNAGVGAAGASGQTGGCAPGYLQSAAGCIDIDDCLSGTPCGAHGRCQNTPGDYVCQCDPGYQSQSGTCVSLDGCQTNNGGCETSCQIGATGAVCSCAKDEWLKADRKTCGAFRPALRLNRTGSIIPTQPTFAFDPEGNGLAAWVQSDGTSTSLWTQRYVAGLGWAATPSELEVDASGVPNAPRVALAANGRGVIIWLQNTESDGDMWAVRYDNPTFGEPSRIDESGTGSAFDPSVQLDGAGNGFAAWTQTDGSNSKIWVNRFVADQGWAGPSAIQTKGGEQAFATRLAVDASGNANLAWTQSTYGSWTGTPNGWTDWTSGNGESAEFSPWTSRYDLKMDRWHTPTELDDTGAAGFPDNQVYGAEANRVAVWPRMIAGQCSIRASTYSGKAGWNDSIDITRRGSDFSMMLPRLALAPSGDGAAIWTELHDTTSEIWANRYRGATGEWLGPTELSSIDLATGAPLPQLAVDPSGDGFAVWSESRGMSRTVKTARLQADVGFVAGPTLSMDVTGNPPQTSAVQITADAHGNALAIWDVMERGLYFVSVSVFE